MENLSADQIRWNQKYLTKGKDALDWEPSDWLARHESLLIDQPKGRALDIACGNGRNAIYLAKLGFQVDAVDISDVAIEWLRQKAHEDNLPITSHITDLEKGNLPRGPYQVIVNFKYLQRDLFPLIKQALAPGGLLFFETLYRAAIDKLNSQMPRPYVLDYNELLHAFWNLHILEYREQIVDVPHTEKKQALACLIAQQMDSNITL